MPFWWPYFGPDDFEEPPRPPGVNQGRRRGVTKSPKPPKRKRR